MADKILRGPELKLQNVSFGKLLLEGLKKGGSKVALIDGATGEDKTYKELLQHTISLTFYLKKFGLAANDTLSICSENSIYFNIPAIAAMYLGIIVAPLNNTYSEREFIHALNISKPKIVFCTFNNLNTIINCKKQIKYIQKIIVLDKCDKLPKSVLKLEDLITLPLLDNFDVVPLEGNHVSAIMCSSGTTGLPKGVMMTHRAFDASLYFMKHHDYGNYNADKIALCLLPLYHAYGYISNLAMLITNMKIIIVPRFEEKMFLESLQNYKVNYATLVPPLILFLCKSPLVAKYNLSHLQEVICGAAMLSKSLQDAFAKRLNIKVRQGYGLTEITLAGTLTPRDTSKTNTVGVLVPGIESKIVDTKTGETLGRNKPGEICFRGVQVMKGYVGNPGATAAAIDKDGWLHSGDVGYFDTDAYLYIVDRFKELIKFKGFQVPPAEIESILLTHPDVLDCAVIGKPDEAAGELPLAFIVRKPNYKSTANEICDYVAQNISYHKRLHGGVRFVESIPKNATGKVLRRILRDQLKIPSSRL